MNGNKITISAILIAILGIVMFSAKAIMVKMAYKFHVTSIHLLLFRLLFSLPFYIIIAFYFQFKNKIKTQKKDYLWVFIMGFVGYYLASYFDFLGLQYIKAGLERIILFIYPTLVLIISKFFLKTAITRKQVIAIIISYLGILVAFWNEIKLVEEDVVLGGSFIFLSALTYAIYLVGSGWLIPRFGVALFTSYAMISSTVCVLIHYLLVDRTNFFQYENEVYYLGFLMAIISTLIPSFLVSLAIKKMSATNFSIIGSIGPISTIILAFFFLGEKLNYYQILGAIIVISAVTYISLVKEKKQ